MNLENLLDINLTHFDEGGTAAADAGGTAGDATGSAAGGESAQGSNEPGDAGQGSTMSPEERAAAYKKFKAEFKDLYDQDVQGHISRRMKKFTGLEQNLKELDADMKKVMKILNVSDRKQALAELEKIQQKRLEDEAYEKGMSVEEYRREMERERKLAEIAAWERKQEEIRQKAAKHQADAIELQRIYPEFNLRAEALNPQFVQLIDEGMSIKAAYEIVHAPEILSKRPEFAEFDFKNWQPNDVFFTMLENGFPIDNAFKVSEMDWWEENIAKRMEKRTADNIKANNQRPKENGANNSPAVNIKKNPSAMTGKEVKELADRILRGDLRPEDVKFKRINLVGLRARIKN